MHILTIFLCYTNNYCTITLVNNYIQSIQNRRAREEVPTQTTRNSENSLLVGLNQCYSA